MGQVTIYLEDDIEAKMTAAANAAQQSKSKWIAGLIKQNVANEWPKSIIGLAGAWQDFPQIEDIRSNYGENVPREDF